MPEDRSQGMLITKAEKFFRENKHSEYLKMKLSGTLNKTCEARANAARDYARRLMALGINPSDAWNQAIRQEILESETD
jgi:hypothetical protein